MHTKTRDRQLNIAQKNALDREIAEESVINIYGNMDKLLGKYSEVGKLNEISQGDATKN